MSIRAIAYAAIIAFALILIGAKIYSVFNKPATEIKPVTVDSFVVRTDSTGIGRIESSSMLSGDSNYIIVDSVGQLWNISTDTSVMIPVQHTVVVDCSLYEAELQKLHRQKDSLRSALFLANMRVNKVKKYLRIVNSKPSQRKFLLGWVNRAVQ